jgi:hypothetical protein
MKNIYTSLLFVLVFSAVSAQSLSWSSEVTVAMGSMYGNIRPRIIVASGNIPVVMWGGGTGTEPLRAARWNGTSFTAPSMITPAGVDPFIDTWAGADMGGEGNNIYIVFKRQPEMMNCMYLVKSSDGGMTWGDTVLITANMYNRFPSVAVTPLGNPVIMYMAFDSTWMSPAYVVINSNDGGQTFTMPVNISGLGSSEVCDCCPGYLAVDGTTQIGTWRRNNNNMRDMWAGISTDGGMSFPTGFDVDNTNWIVTSCPSTGPDPLISGDSLYTVFMSAANGQNRVYISSANFSTQQIAYVTQIASNYTGTTTQNYPFIAGSGDTIAVVWQQVTSGNTDVYYAWSVTGSAGLINTEALLTNSSTGTQRNPHVAFSNGTFHFTWTDLASGNVMYKSATIVPLGMEEEESPALLVYPNPSAGTMTIDLSGFENENVAIEVLDLAGRVLETEWSLGKNQFGLRHRTAGVYIVRITSEEKIIFQKIIFR